MKTVPKKLNINPIASAVPNLTAFLTIKINPFHAAAQKFLPVNAIWNFIKINYTIENFKKEIKNTYLNIRMLCYKFDTSLETI